MACIEDLDAIGIKQEAAIGIANCSAPFNCAHGPIGENSWRRRVKVQASEISEIPNIRFFVIELRFQGLNY